MFFLIFVQILYHCFLLIILFYFRLPWFILAGSFLIGHFVFLIHSQIVLFNPLNAIYYNILPVKKYICES